MLKFNYEELLPYVTGIWVFALSLLSTIVTYFNDSCSGLEIKSPYLTFFRDFFYCQMAGILTYFLATAAGYEPIIVAALVSAGSHMGARLIIAIEEFVLRAIHLCNVEKEQN